MQPSASVSSGCDYSRLRGDDPAPHSCQCRPRCFCHVTERKEQHGAGYQFLLDRKLRKLRRLRKLNCSKTHKAPSCSDTSSKQLPERDLHGAACRLDREFLGCSFCESSLI